MMFVVGCTAVDGVGFPVPEDDEGAEPSFERTGLPDDCVRESEPNDFSDTFAYEYLGLVTEAKSVSLCGAIETSGVVEGSFVGDVDFVMFELVDPLDVELRMNVRGAGDWELQLRDDQGETIDYTLDGTIRERLDPGFYYVLVAAYTGSDLGYELVIDGD